MQFFYAIDCTGGLCSKTLCIRTKTLKRCNRQHLGIFLIFKVSLRQNEFDLIISYVKCLDEGFILRGMKMQRKPPPGLLLKSLLCCQGKYKIGIKC